MKRTSGNYCLEFAEEKYHFLTDISHSLRTENFPFDQIVEFECQDGYNLGISREYNEEGKEVMIINLFDRLGEYLNVAGEYVLTNNGFTPADTRNLAEFRQMICSEICRIASIYHVGGLK